MTASVLKQDPNKTKKGSEERLFIMTRTHHMQIFLKPQNKTKQQQQQQKIFLFFFPTLNK